MKENKICDCCGAKLIEYTHSLNSGLAIGLRKLETMGGVASLKELELTFNQANNFQKLQYWNFIEKHENSKWRITGFGRLFIYKNHCVPKSVTTFRGKTISASKELINIQDLRTKYKNKLDYAKEGTANKDVAKLKSM